jgi:hypothetical protein
MPDRKLALLHLLPPPSSNATVLVVALVAVPVAYNTPAQPQPTYVPPVAVAPTGQSKGGLQTVLNEKQLKVTLTISVVKLGSHKTEPPAEPAPAAPDGNPTPTAAPASAPQA